MKVAIAGYGVEGKASLRYWQQRGDEVTILDTKAQARDMPEGVTTRLGETAFDDLSQYDMVVRTPSLPPAKLASAKKVWSATNEFFARAAEIGVPIIGVTGTKGKGTTCSLIASILRAAGRDVYLVGNIGTPALDVLPSLTSESIVVYELSSFQLWDIKYGPYVSVILMIEPDHLDVHADMNDYLNAKSNIRRFQTASDECIYHPTNGLSRKVAFTKFAGECCDLCPDDISAQLANRYAIKNDDQVYVKKGSFWVQNRKICSVDELKLPGSHNLDNACAAISALYMVLPTVDDQVIAAGFRSFEGLPHRLKFVAEKSGVGYYDDSIATTPGSAIAALAAFEQPKIIILGGSDKGADYHEIVEACAKTNAKIIAVGQTGQKIATIAHDLNVKVTVIDGLMNEAVSVAHQLAEPGDVVILSPASASFDQYKNYHDRGQQFIAAVSHLSHEGGSNE